MYCLSVCYEFVTKSCATPMLRVFALALCNDFFITFLTFLKTEESIVIVP